MVDDAPREPRWWLYVLQCADGTLYVGVTTDLQRRLHEHNHTARGARYTRARRPVRMVAAWSHGSRSEAQKAEAAFRKLSRPEKLARLIRSELEAGDLPQAPEKSTPSKTSVGT